MRVGMLLADLHFGAVELPHYSVEVLDIIEKIRSMDKLDYIIFLGDVFDHKMYIGDPHIVNAVMFIRVIMTIAMHRGIKIRMIYGTESHECGQYVIFKGYETIDGLDFQIIDSVCGEELFDDLKVLYIPEEYITKPKSEYYELFLEEENEYDYIFGHGVIVEGMTMVKKDQGSDWMTSKAPKFTTADFKKSLKGEVFFGHYHTHTDITDNTHYVGSYSRWKHGEEDPKGYMIVTKDGGSYTHEFIENPAAITYKTVSFGYGHPIFSGEGELEDHIKGIDRMISVYPDKSRVRLILNIPEGYPNPEFFMEYIKEKYRSNQLVTLEFVNGYVDAKRKQDKEELHNVIKRYDYILNKKDTVGETISKFILDKTGKEIPVEKVNIYLSQNLQDILNTENT